jgi:hypothetical protein
MLAIKGRDTGNMALRSGNTLPWKKDSSRMQGMRGAVVRTASGQALKEALGDREQGPIVLAQDGRRGHQQLRVAGQAALQLGGQLGL